MVDLQTSGGEECCSHLKVFCHAPVFHLAWWRVVGQRIDCIPAVIQNPLGPDLGSQPNSGLSTYHGRETDLDSELFE
jgi:hypothetical protein